VHRPWGSYDSVDVGDGFQVKRIKVKPARRCRCNRTAHRAEHWIVVRASRASPQRRCVRPARQRKHLHPHRRQASAEKSGRETLELIEVQSGALPG
jgi:mannose-1-phosphate guanylyltransferase/mannose-6-phosphate isomerase